MNTVAEPVGHGFRVLDERLCRGARGPAARVLECLRRIPVEERRERLDAVRKQLVHESIVEVESRRVDLPAPLRHDARPRDREAERVEPELSHQRDVVAVAVVEVARDLPGVAVADLSGRRAEPVPYAFASSVLVCRTLDLVRGGSGAPDEIVGEGALVGGHRCSSRSFGRGSDMATGGVLRALLYELRSDTRANIDRQRAARDEAAAVGRIDRGGSATLALLDPLRL